MRRALLVLCCVLLVVGEATAGLSTRARRKTYVAGELFTAADVNADNDAHIAFDNQLAAFFVGDSLKVPIVATDTLVSKTLGKILFNHPLIGDSIRVNTISAQRAWVDTVRTNPKFAAGLTVLAGQLATIASGTIDTIASRLLYLHRAVYSHGEKWTSPVVAGGATADTVRIWRGAARGIAHDDTLVVVTGLDTSATYRLELTVKLNNQTTIATYGLNMTLNDALVDTIPGHAKCGFTSGNCSGTTGDDGQFNVCGYNTGATGSLEFENRVYTAWSADVVWTLTGGNP